MTAAHRSLPFGTKLRVTHGGSSVIVTINDRGPFVRGRVLDLSTGAARAIGLTGAGVGRVTAEVVS
jgi:rare lipoprotein A